MRVFPVASVLLLSLSAFPFAAQAVSISELPATIQSCITAGSCGVNLSSSYDSGTASAFSMFDMSSGLNWLVRYNLVSPSGEMDINGTQNTAYNGYLWMQVANNYSAAETAHSVTLFLDKVAPVPNPMLFQNGDLSLFMTTADMLAGGAYIKLQDYEEYGYYSAGSLSGEVPQICLAAGCQISAQLNLVQLNYQSFGSAGIVMAGFDADDTRGLVYSQSYAYLNGYPPYGTTQSFYITAVPEPETFWMLGFGLLSVAIAARRRRI